jgi:uncharacterized membrane protein YphA (DoxX/SURF4 family)
MRAGTRQAEQASETRGARAAVAGRGLERAGVPAEAGRQPPRPAPGPAERLAPWLATAARLLLAGVWVWAAAAKIADPDGAVRAVRAYWILPDGLAELVGWGLPFLELGLAVLLALGLATRFAAAASALLLGLFMAGIAAAWARGLRIDCGCFGGGGDDPTAGAGTYLVELARDAGLLLVAVLLAVWPRSRLAVDGRIAGTAPAGTAQSSAQASNGPFPEDR